MTAILKIAKWYALQRRPAAAVLTLPRQPRLFAFSVSAAGRRWIAIAAIAGALIAAIVYIASVNVILFTGEAIRRDQPALAALEQESAALAGALAALQSPAWLEARARTDGMVEALGVRFVSPTDVVALSH